MSPTALPAWPREGDARDPRQPAGGTWSARAPTAAGPRWSPARAPRSRPARAPGGADRRVRHRSTASGAWPSGLPSDKAPPARRREAVPLVAQLPGRVSDQLHGRLDLRGRDLLRAAGQALEIATRTRVDGRTGALPRSARARPAVTGCRRGTRRQARLRSRSRATPCRTARPRARLPTGPSRPRSRGRPLRPETVRNARPSGRQWRGGAAGRLPAEAKHPAGGGALSAMLGRRPSDFARASAARAPCTAAEAGSTPHVIKPRVVHVRSRCGFPHGGAVLLVARVRCRQGTRPESCSAVLADFCNPALEWRWRVCRELLQVVPSAHAPRLVAHDRTHG